MSPTEPHQPAVSVQLRRLPLGSSRETDKLSPAHQGARTGPAAGRGDHSGTNRLLSEQEQSGRPEFCTELEQTRTCGRRQGHGPARAAGDRPEDVAEALRAALAHDGPSLVDVVTNPQEISVPPKPTVQQGWAAAA